MKRIILTGIILLLIAGITTASLSIEDTIKIENYITTKLGREVTVEKQIEPSYFKSNHVGFVYDKNRKVFMSKERYDKEVLNK